MPLSKRVVIATLTSKRTLVIANPIHSSLQVTKGVAAVGILVGEVGQRLHVGMLCCSKKKPGPTPISSISSLHCEKRLATSALKFLFWRQFLYYLS